MDETQYEGRPETNKKHGVGTLFALGLASVGILDTAVVVAV